MVVRTILIMAGGTGGHVFPGLAVADYLRALGWRVVWLGTKNGMEARLVPQYGYDIRLINFSGLRGKCMVTWLMLPLRLLRAFWQSGQVIFRVRPDVVLGMGGYPAFPGGMMATLLNKPLLIHEQNSIPGLSNRILAKLADKILVGFPDVMDGGESRVIFSGNPVRDKIGQLEIPEKRFRGRDGKLRLLVIGGSLGAQVLNMIVPQALGLIPENLRPFVIHQAGARNLDALRRNYAEVAVEGELVGFIEDMAPHYATCDLVLCRAGALTISELAAAGIASILIPFPFAVDDHQTHNAKFLSNHNAAVLVPQNQLNPQDLMELLLGMTREKLLEMAIAARSLAKPDATQRVAVACIEMART
ncbi:UDP-N-acetylglucosamine-N-acetylmuramylpentapeptide N-acetylglucosamine transferase [Nitrosomonas cryotolerans]|uniref:UDP-N-acetylglucosamine--N-acetylmuramyl-(pentapeptide) pyrophosphoryl-undecaprenol N-acetylglucosamine transferase n=1 Tax=Nitrosomonas cryotolerans ATCC 49181 TaxID=1131553 RepID=A0A1N6FMC3_9PROT|nr:undecaprenyldiphospho-muramoylpentapeptide beta-N-acetylglucosaminyltransferase [Nitrosomonas cryotolerans]SFP78115.1 UDP-N-acetylglucosamine-N-acetylmuramylpentapeptide N-acetylglucosamine transferase [Nitrosomonas cryotolerans]SIN96388.1 UDP-N-acetylglucosamine-N-acetylmuramylpentapeptide N-acetylglucosamine transferase [Nitrosomonas cryotolerans ATCC 49181]